MIKIKSDKIIIEKQLFDGYLYIENDKIVEVSKEDKPCDEFYDYTGKYVSPGFIEIHTHGAGGYCFINSCSEDMIKGCEYHLDHGATSILPTVTSGPFKNMKKAVGDIAEAMQSGKCKSNILGAHMEGPYFSLKQAGAQCPDYITPPVKEDYESLIKDYPGIVKRFSFAPENDKDAEFTKFLVKNDIIAAIGHSDAKYQELKDAIDSGCNLVTHLYSGCSTVTRDHGFRSLGVVETAFLRDELYAEIIADGKHLPPDLIKMIVKIKGMDKTILCTDSLEIAGTDIVEGFMSGTAFIVEDGVCKLKDRTAFAGSVATFDRLIRVMTQECGYTVAESVYMGSKVPAELLKVQKGILKAGYDADVIVFDDDINVSDIFVMGRKVK